MADTPTLYPAWRFESVLVTLAPRATPHPLVGELSPDCDDELCPSTFAVSVMPEDIEKPHPTAWIPAVAVTVRLPGPSDTS